MAHLKKDWVITQRAFDCLLALLGPDREIAGAKHEELRSTLIRYLMFRGSSRPEEHADEALMRTARKLDEGLRLDRNDYTGYFCQVAYKVLQEHWRLAEKAPVSLHSLPPVVRPYCDPDETRAQDDDRLERERRLSCLQECMRELSAEDRKLILSYYRETGQAKIKARNALAEKMGGSRNMLRIKIHRIKSRLEEWVNRSHGDPAPDDRDTRSRRPQTAQPHAEHRIRPADYRHPPS